LIFIAGINDGEKKLNYRQEILCKECNRQGFLEIIMYSRYLSLFFIPVFRWKKEYYATTTCCNTMYKIDDEIIKRLKRREISHIPDEELKRNYFYEKTCANCRYVSPPDFAYCPKCGSRL
jgi:hypothetical protein